MTHDSFPRPVEVQTPAGTLAPSLVRTLLPFLAGLLGTFLLDQFAIEVDSNATTALLTAGIGYLYYAAARFLEVYGSDKWGYILGFRRQPVYAPTVPSTVIARENNRGEAGEATVALIGLVLGVLGVAVLAFALIDNRHDFVVPAAVSMAIGLVLYVLGTRNHYR